MAKLMNVPYSLGERDCDGSLRFWVFKRQLYHASVAAILRPLLPGMTSYVIRRCPDGHYRRVVYDLVAFIADYPEQVLLAGIVQGWCAKYVYYCRSFLETRMLTNASDVPHFREIWTRLLIAAHLHTRAALQRNLIPRNYGSSMELTMMSL